MQFKQETMVIREGSAECKHAFITKDGGSVGVYPISHEVTRACFLCGQIETVRTYKDNSDPFTFEAIVDRFDK
jgi:hypothetical protein